ncbi:MAG: Uma2 family endonuclease [Cyanophyceae cyanobacterium]
MSQPLIDSDALINPDISHIVTEDDTPVDNFQSEKQQRLLVEPLYSSWTPDSSFIAAANVGLFYALKEDPIVPDAMLSLGVQMPQDWSQKKNRSYFVWELGKVPEVCIEIVSNRKGEELGEKKALYAQIGIAYYAVFDPLRQLQEVEQMNGEILLVWELSGGQYVPLSLPFWLERVGLGLTVWEGEFEQQPGEWLRWCRQNGQVIPTGAERAIQEESRANQERARADRLAERLRALGINGDED